MEKFYSHSESSEQNNFQITIWHLVMNSAQEYDRYFKIEKKDKALSPIWIFPKLIKANLNVLSEVVKQERYNQLPLICEIWSMVRQILWLERVAVSEDFWPNLELDFLQMNQVLMYIIKYDLRFGWLIVWRSCWFGHTRKMEMKEYRVLYLIGYQAIRTLILILRNEFMIH